MFVQTFNSRFKMLMYSDARLTDLSPNFCLCANCSKSDMVSGVICQTHNDFMEMTQKLKIVAPVFACADFEEMATGMDYLAPLLGGEVLPEELRQEVSRLVLRRTKEEWKVLQKLWADYEQVKVAAGR